MLKKTALLARDGFPQFALHLLFFSLNAKYLVNNCFPVLLFAEHQGHQWVDLLGRVEIVKHVFDRGSCQKMPPHLKRGEYGFPFPQQPPPGISSVSRISSCNENIRLLQRQEVEGSLETNITTKIKVNQIAFVFEAIQFWDAESPGRLREGFMDSICIICIS